MTHPDCWIRPFSTLYGLDDPTPTPPIKGGGLIIVLNKKVGAADLFVQHEEITGES